MIVQMLYVDCLTNRLIDRLDRSVLISSNRNKDANRRTSTSSGSASERTLPVLSAPFSKGRSVESQVRCDRIAARWLREPQSAHTDVAAKKQQTKPANVLAAIRPRTKRERNKKRTGGQAVLRSFFHNNLSEAV